MSEYLVKRRNSDGREHAINTDDELEQANADISSTGLDGVMALICLRGNGLSIPGGITYFLRKKKGSNENPDLQQ